MNLKGAKEFEFEQKAKIEDGGVYKLQFTGITSSMDEGKKGFKDFKTGKMKEWIILKAKVIEEGFNETKASKFINYFEDVAGLSEEEIKDNNKSLKAITEFYERIVGEEAPDEMEPDDIFMALENAEFATKVFVDKMWEVFEPGTGKVINTQLKYGEAYKQVDDMNSGSLQIEPVECKEVPKINEWEGKTFQSYSFSPWVISEADYEAEKAKAAGTALKTAPAEQTGTPIDPQVVGGTDWDIQIDTESTDDVDEL